MSVMRTILDDYDGEGWNTETKLSVVLDFLDDEADRDRAIERRFRAWLVAAIDATTEGA